MFSKRAGDIRSRRKGDQITSGRSHQMEKSSVSSGKERQSAGALDQISDHRHRAQTRSQQRAGEQHGECLSGDWNRADRDYYLGGERGEQTKTDYQTDLTHDIKRRQGHAQKCLVLCKCCIHFSDL